MIKEYLKYTLKQKKKKGNQMNTVSSSKHTEMF